MARKNPDFGRASSGLVPITVQMNAFIHKRISDYWGEKHPWFPLIPVRNFYILTNSSDRSKFEGVDTNHHKVYFRFHVDGCLLGKRDTKATLDFAHTGITLQKERGFVPQSKQATWDVKRFESTSTGFCTNIDAEFQAHHPFTPPSPYPGWYPVVVKMQMSICTVCKDELTGKVLVKMYGHFSTTAFPDRDVLYKTDGSWINWIYKKSIHNHAIDGLIFTESWKDESDIIEMTCDT